MKTFPIMLTLQGKLAVVIGGGSVGLRKVQALLDAQAKVRLITGANAQLETEPDCEIIREDYRPEHLEGASLVFACTDDHDTNSTISADARKLGILVNAADQNDDCDFFMPATFRDKDVVVAIGTGGCAPAVTGVLKRRIQKALPERIGEFAELINEYREQLKETQPDSQKRMDIMKALCDEESLDEFRTGRHRALRFRYSLAVSGQLPSQRGDDSSDVDTPEEKPLGATLKLILMGIFVIALPWAGINYFIDSKSNMITGFGHKVLAAGSLVCLIAAGIFGFRYLRTAKRLRHKDPQTILTPGLSLEALDTRCRRVIQAALVLLTAAITLGVTAAILPGSDNWFAKLIAGPMIIGSIFAWVVCTAACVTTLSEQFRGKRTAILSITASIIITIITALVLVISRLSS